MYGGSVKVPMVVRSMIGKSWGQGAQHSQGLHSLFMHIPGLKVVAPSNAHDAKGCMIAAIRDDNPVIFVEHRLLYFSDAYVPEESFTVEPGKSRIITHGDDITVVAVSNMVMECLRAQEILADEGIQAEVIDPIWLVPLESDTIVASAERTGRLLVVDNAWLNCGASAEIVARVTERAKRPVQVARLGFASTSCPPSPTLEHAFYPNPATIAGRIHEMVLPGVAWEPDSDRAKLSYQAQFRGPF
jgi:pyruvate dehydrogenase E1 component beta subunit